MERRLIDAFLIKFKFYGSYDKKMKLKYNYINKNVITFI